MQYKQVSSLIRLENGQWAKTDERKALTFSLHLKNVLKLHVDILDKEFLRDLNDFLSAPLPLSLPPISFSSEQM